MMRTLLPILAALALLLDSSGKFVATKRNSKWILLDKGELISLLPPG